MKKEEVTFLDKVFPSNWPGLIHGFLGHIVLLPCMMEAAVRPQAVACWPCPRVQAVQLPHKARVGEAGPLHENQTSFCSGRILEVIL